MLNVFKNDYCIRDKFSNIDREKKCPDEFCRATCVRPVVGKKYDYFSLLRKQMDTYVRKVYIVRKVTSAPTFLAQSNTCLHDVYRLRRVLKIDF